MTMPLQLYLIRHGETAWSLSGQYTGRTDLPLTEHGKAMALKLAPGLASIHFSSVLTSPLMRARNTCELAGLGGIAEVEPELAEWDYGDYDGRLGAAIRNERADWDVWSDGCPGGETPADVSARADRLIGRLARLKGCVALFGHGQFGRVLAARWIGLAAHEGQHLLFAPARFGILGFDAGHPGRHVISLWNATTDSIQELA